MRPSSLNPQRSSFRFPLTTYHFPARLVQIAALAVFAFLFMGAGDSEARFNSIGHKLMCRCGCNQILLECNHVGCEYSERMRGELTAALTRGDSDDLILQAFVQKYGATVLAAPTTTGFNRVAWIMPFAIFTGGLLAVVLVVRRWKLRPAAAIPAVSPEMEEFRERARKETEV